jgi:hypothetical protein
MGPTNLSPALRIADEIEQKWGTTLFHSTNHICVLGALGRPTGTARTVRSL